jgi:hypothetical protein
MKIKNKNIYKWPANIEDCRNKKELVSLPKEKNLDLIIGEKNNKYLLSVIFSGEDLTVAKMTLPINKYSEVESHEGDEVVNVIKGVLLVNIYSEEENSNPKSVSRTSYHIREGEKMLIPANYKHVYKNLDEINVEAIVSIGPKL